MALGGAFTKVLQRSRVILAATKSWRSDIIQFVELVIVELVVVVADAVVAVVVLACATPIPCAYMWPRFENAADSPAAAAFAKDRLQG